ncbi:MAG: hypothetical protein ABI873_00685 [Marmoricola sp.]
MVRGRTVALINLDGAAAAAGHGAIVLSTSGDGGQTWHSHTVLQRNQPIILASIATGRDGSLGLVWDEIDTSAVNCASSTIPSRTRFAGSRDAGASWAKAVTVGAPWWNLASGARGTGGFSGYFIGDYQSLAAIPAGFTTATVQGQLLLNPQAQPAITGDTGMMVAIIRR